MLISGKHEKSLKGAEIETTNNRMELQAAIEALKALKRGCEVELYTDSQYVRLGVLEWLGNWKLSKWKTANKKPVKNRDLWESLDQQLSRHKVSWHWVKGHSGNAGNEKADSLANHAIDELLSEQS